MIPLGMLGSFQVNVISLEDTFSSLNSCGLSVGALIGKKEVS